MSSGVRRFPVIMGPTASGKSALALELAGRLGGEIISLDSMQIYRGLDCGTAKPSTEERKRIPHHLIDILEPAERSDLFTIAELAEKAVSEIRSRGKLPIAAGGTGLYVRAFVYGLDNVPADPELRRRLDSEFDSDSGFEKLKVIMEEKSPADYELWKAHRRKLIRAYEVFLLTGGSMAERLRAWKEHGPRADAVQFVLEWPREELRKRIEERCRTMLENGWIEETERLEQQGLFRTPTAWQALGYPIISEYLHGKVPREKLPELISNATWQFARRQMTWFRGQHREAIPLAMPRPLRELAVDVESHLA